MSKCFPPLCHTHAHSSTSLHLTSLKGCDAAPPHIVIHCFSKSCSVTKAGRVSTGRGRATRAGRVITTTHQSDCSGTVAPCLSRRVARLGSPGEAQTATNNAKRSLSRAELETSAEVQLVLQQHAEQNKPHRRTAGKVAARWYFHGFCEIRAKC